MNRLWLFRAAVLCLALLPGFSGLQAQLPRIVQWVQDAPASDSSKIALGYPVPIPVDTPLPFAGFRSYAGLHMRHQDLAATTPWVHPFEVGRTRSDRAIWAYRLGDADLETRDGMPEQAMLTNGGIHAREWQSPEVATGIIELLATTPDDNHLIAYLRDNANILVIPVLNVDGFLQTQRYPDSNWLGTDPNDPDGAPRDGRMRRKNMLRADEDLMTRGDHLQGVDLNRNNPPFWATNPARSSGNSESLVYHGQAAQSEPEIQALDAAVQLGPAGMLSMYTDLHSYSQVHFWVRNDNDRLARQTESLLSVFSNFHRSFPAGKLYGFSSRNNAPRNSGIGLTDEYFTHVYQVPSWTLEIEPSRNAGADYGGLGRNGHDGFVLPESEVERVRTELAQTFAVAYYRQAGPPSISTLSIIDDATGAAVYQAEWDPVGAGQRALHRFQAQPLQLERDYTVWVAWDKPMRWREGGKVVPLPGQPSFTLSLEHEVRVQDSNLNAFFGDEEWLAAPGGAPGGFLHYRDDAVAFPLRLLANENNAGLLDGATDATLALGTSDMTGMRGDADPATVAHWDSGAWAGYEDSNGEVGSDNGGTDTTVGFKVTPENLSDPFVIEPGTSSAWFDPAHDGEGFLLEILAGGRAQAYWFTYDGEGNQDWYVAIGEIRGNRILFPELLRVSGGEFGPGFDPDKVVRTPVGSASFIWSSCDAGEMKWVIDRDGGPRRQGRQSLTRLTRLMGLDCGRPILPPERPEGRLSGSWYDPSHSGEGYVLEVLFDSRVLVYWFSYDEQGKRRWFVGVGEIVDGKLLFPDMLTTRGGIFGDGFDPATVKRLPWGSLELELGCNSGTARFEPTEPGFPAGTLNLSRLTLLNGLSCEPAAN